MEEVAILYICTGNYAKLFQQFYQSARINFLPQYSKHYYVWTDEDIGEYEENEVTIIPKHFEEWPAATLQRYKDFLGIKDEILKHKYVYFCNADLNIFKEVGEEILPDDEHPLVGVLHIQFVKPQLKMQELVEATEKRLFSHAYIDRDDFPYPYIFGCLNGGKTKEFMEMSQVIADWTDDDLRSGIIPPWHDESYLNAYMIENKELFKFIGPEYAYPDKSLIPGYEPYIYKIHKPSFFLSQDFRKYVSELDKQLQVKSALERLFL